MARNRLRMSGEDMVIDSSIANEAIIVPVGGIDFVSIQAFSQSGTFAGTYTIEISNDGLAWTAAAYLNADTGAATAVSTITAAGVTRRIPCFDIQYLRIRNSSAAGTARIQFAVYGEGVGGGGGGTRADAGRPGEPAGDIS